MCYRLESLRNGALVNFNNGQLTVVVVGFLEDEISVRVDIVCCAICLALKRRLGVHKQGNDEAVKTQDFGENEDKNHADEQSGLLRSTAHTGITDDTNSETSGHTGEADGKTSTELDEPGEERNLGLETVRDEDGHDEAIDTNDTSHNDGNDVCYKVNMGEQLRPRENRLGETHS